MADRGRLIDPRLRPARGDVAAAHLRGEVEAERFVEGRRAQAICAAAGLYKDPSETAELQDQVLFGEGFRIYDEDDDWVWGQSEADDYVGYVRRRDLSDDVVEPDRRVTAIRTLLFSKPDLKSTPLGFLSLNTKIASGERRDGYVQEARGGWIVERHLAALDDVISDYVAVAEMYLGAPYLWGGKESLGLDCSGLVQMALERAGIRAPRDTDQQEASLRRDIDLGDLRRGDLVFWRGHVGFMIDPDRLLHANAFHMATAIEPLEAAVKRITPLEGPPRAFKRLA